MANPIVERLLEQLGITQAIGATGSALQNTWNQLRAGASRALPAIAEAQGGPPAWSQAAQAANPSWLRVSGVPTTQIERFGPRAAQVRAQLAAQPATGGIAPTMAEPGTGAGVAGGTTQPGALDLSDEALVQQLLMQALGGTGSGGNYNYNYSTTPSSLDWAELALQERQLQLQEQQMMLADARAREQLAQQMQIANLQQQQAQRGMAAQMGQTIAGLQSQNWATALPYKLPTGTQYAPGFGPGGAASQLARMTGTRYTPQRLAPAPEPTVEEMEDWLESAIAQFGP